jgi:aldose 1-epimerase
MTMHAIFQTISSPNGLIQLQICAQHGGSISRFTYKDVPLMRAFDETLPAPSIAPDLWALNMSGFPLTPYSNRIGHGKLHFQDQVYDIKDPLICGDHPNHGDGLACAWAVTHHTDHELVLEIISKSNPYHYKATQTFVLDDTGLSLSIEITNLSDLTLPFGTGHHTYYPRNDQTILKFNAPDVWESNNMLPTQLVKATGKFDFSQGKILNDENLTPTGQGDDGSAYLDHCFQGWDQTAEIIWPDQKTKLRIGADQIFENFVVYIPSNQNFICAEPVTNITDGFNQMHKGAQNTGTVILAPKQSLVGKMIFSPVAL